MGCIFFRAAKAVFYVVKKEMKAFILRYAMYQKEWGKKCPDFFKKYKIHSCATGKFGVFLA